MTKEQAIEILTDAEKFFESMDAGELFSLDEEIEAFKMAIEALKQKPEWIPVSERLPEEGNTTYMTTVDYGELGMATGQRFFYGKYIGWEDDAVVAWMPKPEPWEGEEDV